MTIWSTGERAMSVVIGGAPFRGVLFDLDGVVTDTAIVHFGAWRRLFRALSERNPGIEIELSHGDYLEFLDGRERRSGLASYLRNKGVFSGMGTLDRAESLDALAREKDAYFLAELDANGVTTIGPTVCLLERLRAAGVPAALVSASRNAGRVLERAEVGGLFAIRVDGIDAAKMRLAGKPNPDMYLEAARRLRLRPEHCVVVEDSQPGVRAAQDGGFGLSLGLGPGGSHLLSKGADLVFDDLDKLDVGFSSIEPRPGDNVDEKCGLCRDPGDGGWSLEYRGVDPDSAGGREVLLTQGNGYFATRGALPEVADDGRHYPGVYVAGCYNRLTSRVDGRTQDDESIVNLPNWTHFSFRTPDGVWLGAGTHLVLHHHELFDLRHGIVRRESVLADTAGRITRIRQQRLVSMDNPHLAALTTTITAENWSGPLEVRSGIDVGVANGNVPEYALLDNSHLEHLFAGAAGADSISSAVETTSSRIRIDQAERLRVSHPDGAAVKSSRKVDLEDYRISQVIECAVAQGKSLVFEKTTAIVTSRDRSISEPQFAVRKYLDDVAGNAELVRRQGERWDELWRRFSTELDSDVMIDLAVKVHTAHVLQTLSPHSTFLDVGVPARGLSGEAYRGHVFWDELFVLPMLSMRLPELARSLLLYRYRRLARARQNAHDAGFGGAMFPWQSGSDGREETPLWMLNPRSGRWMRDNSRRQHHVNLAVAHNVWRYWEITADVGFLSEFGVEILCENARFWASLAQYDTAAGRYDIRGVMGPDEFHDGYPGRAGEGIDNNSYVNIMVAWSMARALDALTILGGAEYCGQGKRWIVSAAELQEWERMSRRLRLVFLDNGILGQFEGYQNLIEFDWVDYRSRYGDLGRLDLILEAEGDSCNNYRVSKQADVLMLLYLFSADELASLIRRLGYPFDPESIPGTVEYYMRRTSNGSTLSRVAHAWVLIRGNRPESWEILLEALSTDLSDVQGAATREGVHLGAMAGSVDIVDRCYTGLEFRDNMMWLHPQLPRELGKLTFDIQYRGHWLRILCDHGQTSVSSAPGAGSPISISIDDKIYEIASGGVVTHRG